MASDLFEKLWNEAEKNIQDEFKRQLSKLIEGIVEVTPEDEFKVMLLKSLIEKRPLRVKCGIDPTRTDVHLGHLVPYRKMRQFQDFGHVGVVVIGDYTAQIGDPSGKNESRPALTYQEVQDNAKTYMEQIYTVLDKSKTEIRYQSEWFEKQTLRDILGWAQETTLAKLISHDTFKTRLEKGYPLGLHEFFYPVLQGMDSVFINADIELGGSDQKFNVLMGRDYQRHRKMRPQVAILFPLLTGLCGKEKMSKSLGNYIAVNDTPMDKFGKTMRIPDSLMLEYFRYATNESESEIYKIGEGLKTNTLHPNEVKKNLAMKVVAIFHGDEAALNAKNEFEAIFREKQTPDEVSEAKDWIGKSLIQVLVDEKVCESNSEARRLIKQNGLSFSHAQNEKITDEKLILSEKERGFVIKAGKRKFLKLV